MLVLKDDFQFVLRTLAREFVCVFCFFFVHVRHHKMLTFRNYLHEVNSKFQRNCHYGC